MNRLNRVQKEALVILLGGDVDSRVSLAGLLHVPFATADATIRVLRRNGYVTFVVGRGYKLSIKGKMIAESLKETK